MHLTTVKMAKVHRQMQIAAEVAEEVRATAAVRIYLRYKSYRIIPGYSQTMTLFLERSLKEKIT